MLPYSSSMALSFALVVLVRIVVVDDFGEFGCEFVVAASGDKEMRCCCCCFERESLLMLLLLEMVE